MRIDALTVSVNFDDYLSYTLARMKEVFDRVVVVTIAEDAATRALCEAVGVEAVLSTRVHEHGERFNLPALINDGYRALAPTEWAVKLDTDILLPPDARAKMEQELGDPELLWGSARYFAETAELLERFLATNDYGLLEPPYETTADVLGFLQVFHARSSAMRGRSGPYEDQRFEGPSRTNDRTFSAMWTPEQRRRFSFDVIHLGLDAIGTNWKGRKAPRFFKAREERGG